MNRHGFFGRAGYNDKVMDRVEALEREIGALDDAEFQRLAAWITEREAELWDAEIARDSEAGRLDFLIEEAERERRAGTLGNLFDGGSAPHN
jgi:hypothetical protein